MKKLFLAAMSCLLVASSAYAFESTISGSYYVRGQSYNYDFKDSADKYDQTRSYYDQNFSAAIQINTDENTYVALDVEVRDEEPMAGASDKGFHADYVYLSHTFGTGTTVQVGDLDSPRAWGNTLGAYSIGVDDRGFGLKVAQDIGMGSIIFITEKLRENQGAGSQPNLVERTTMDRDVYLLGADLDFGNVKFAPAITFEKNGAIPAVLPTGATPTALATLGSAGVAGTEIWGLDLSATAIFGALSLEGEFIYNDVSSNVANSDYDNFGVYAKGSYDFGFMSAGALVAYASVDDMGTATYGDDKGFDLGGGDDFTPLTLFGNELDGVEDINGDTPFASSGATIIALFASAPISDELTVSGTLGYVESSFDEIDDEGVSAIEIDLGASYKITDALVYSVKTAYMTVDADDADDEIDVFYVENKLSLSF